MKTENINKLYKNGRRPNDKLASAKSDNEKQRNKEKFNPIINNKNYDIIRINGKAERLIKYTN